jgi:Tfp pilus assembly protein PilF
MKQMRKTMRTTNRLAPVLPALLAAALLAGCAAPPAPAPAKEPADAAAIEQLGTRAEQALAAGELSEAGRLYVQLLAAAPNNTPAWYRLGIVYLRSGKPAYAQQAFERALQLDPSLTKAHANLALAHLGQFRESARQALAGRQISDDNRRALQALLADVNQVLPAETGPVMAR